MNRRATVHDLTTLALHPTGSRARAGQTNAIQDARGNWIARDAGGRGVVAKRPRLRPGDVSSEDEDEEAQERYDLTEADVLSEARNDNGPWTSRHGRATVRVQSDINAPKDERARKRHKFVHDVDFLENFTSAQKTQKSDLPNPSSVCLIFPSSCHCISIGLTSNQSPGPPEAYSSLCVTLLYITEPII